MSLVIPKVIILDKKTEKDEKMEVSNNNSEVSTTSDIAIFQNFNNIEESENKTVEKLFFTLSSTFFLERSSLVFERLFQL